MTLKELKKMIAEEYATFKKTNKSKIQEQPEPMPDLPDLPGISVSDDDVDATGGGGDAESTLKDIQNMIEDYFTEDEDVDDADADDAPEDVEGDEEEEADLEELANNGVGKAAKTSSGPNAGYGNAKSSKGDGKLHEVRKRLAKKSNSRKKTFKPNAQKTNALLESKIQRERFQKLANIKK